MISKTKPKMSNVPSLQVKPFPCLLPIMRQVVFVDWHGVLSEDVFWFSILEHQRHPYRQQLKLETQKLFQHRMDLVHAWMRGELQSAEVISLLNVSLDRRTRADYLLRRLYSDCRKMRVNGDLLLELSKIRPSTFVVIATDNMDCFFDQIDSRRDIRSSVDAVLCSSNLGVLKSENIHLFFEPWLKQHHLSFSESLLLDDSIENCEAFRRAGGTAHVVKSTRGTIEALRDWHRPEFCWNPTPCIGDT
jgi:FMN phosphatase YigB (HAD superfamily)